MAKGPHNRINILINEAIGLNIDVHATLEDEELHQLQQKINTQQNQNLREHAKLERAEDAINAELFRRADAARKGLTNQAAILESFSETINKMPVA